MLEILVIFDALCVCVCGERVVCRCQISYRRFAKYVVWSKFRTLQ